MIYEPKDNGFSGTVEIQDASLMQRLRYIDDCNFSIDKQGNVVTNFSALKPMLKMYEIAGSHVKKVNVKHESGTHYKTWKSLTEDALCDNIVQTIGNLVLQGPQLGEH